MYLKISSPDWVIFEWEVKEVYVPTEDWYVGILPWHVPLVSVVKPWILKFKPEKQLSDEEFIFEDDFVNVSVSKWLLFVDWKQVIVTTSKWVSKPEESLEILQKMKEDLQKQIEELKAKGSIEEIEKALVTLQTIEAEIRLLQKKGLLR